MKARLTAGRAAVELTIGDIDNIQRIVAGERNRLAASLAWQMAARPERDYLDDLLLRLETVRQAMKERNMETFEPLPFAERRRKGPLEHEGTERERKARKER